MLSSNKAWNWLCISEALKVGPHSVAEKKMQLKLVDRSLWKSGRANTTSHSCNVYELMQYFISIFSPPLCEQRQQMGEKENRINIDRKCLFKRAHFFHDIEMAARSIKIRSHYIQIWMISIELSWRILTLFHPPQFCFVLSFIFSC